MTDYTFLTPITDGTSRTVDEAAALLEMYAPQLLHVLKGLDLDEDAPIETTWKIDDRGLVLAIVDREELTEADEPFLLHLEAELETREEDTLLWDAKPTSPRLLSNRQSGRR